MAIEVKHGLNPAAVAAAAAGGAQARSRQRAALGGAQAATSLERQQTSLAAQATQATEQRDFRTGQATLGHERGLERQQAAAGLQQEAAVDAQGRRREDMVFGITEKQRLRDKQLENALADAMENPDLSEADKAQVAREIAFKRAQIKPIPQLRTPTAQERFDKDRVVDETGQRHIPQADGTFKPVPRETPKVTPEVTAKAYDTAYKILSQDGVVPTEKAIDDLVGKILGVQGGGAQGAQQPGAVSPVAQPGQPQAAAIVDGEVNALAEELRIQPAEARQILAKRDAGRASQPTRPQAATPAQQAAQAIERGPAEALLDQQQGGDLTRGETAAQALLTAERAGRADTISMTSKPSGEQRRARNEKRIDKLKALLSSGNDRMQPGARSELAKIIQEAEEENLVAEEEEVRAATTEKHRAEAGAAQETGQSSTFDLDQEIERIGGEGAASIKGYATIVSTSETEIARLRKILDAAEPKAKKGSGLQALEVTRARRLIKAEERKIAQAREDTRQARDRVELNKERATYRSRLKAKGG